MCATDNVESQLIVYLCVSRSLKELPLPCAAQKFIPVNHHAPSREDSIRHTRDLDSLKHRIIHAHVVSFGADGVLRWGSKITRSASLPTAIVPFRGYRPKSLAGVVETSSTNRFTLKRPWATPPE